MFLLLFFFATAVLYYDENGKCISAISTQLISSTNGKYVSTNLPKSSKFAVKVMLFYCFIFLYIIDSCRHSSSKKLNVIHN